MHSKPTKDGLVFACAIAVALFYRAQYGSASSACSACSAMRNQARPGQAKPGHSLPWQAIAGYGLAWQVEGGEVGKK